VAGKLRLELAQLEDVARFTRFGIEVGEVTRRRIQRGERLRAVLGQPAHRPLSLASQVVVLVAATEGFLDEVALEDVPAFEDRLLARLEAEHAGPSRQINTTGELSQENREALIIMIADSRTVWLEGQG
jgi:F-type H+-transporting ATPase subunit alpha